MKQLLHRNRARVNHDLASMETRKYFSPACYAAYQVIRPALLAHLHGRCIDIGCGDRPYGPMVQNRVAQYDSIDREQRAGDLTYRGDIQDMSMIDDACYDSALCLAVLEHIPDPFKAVREIQRILKKEATLVCSVPHLSRLHEAPHDYYRFTRYGLTYLLETSGFRIISIQPTGGLACFLGHQLSSALLLPVWHILILKKAAFWINRRLIVPACIAGDRHFDRSKRFALGYVCVARKMN